MFGARSQIVDVDLAFKLLAKLARHATGLAHPPADLAHKSRHSRGTQYDERNGKNHYQLGKIHPEHSGDREGLKCRQPLGLRPDGPDCWSNLSSSWSWA